MCCVFLVYNNVSKLYLPRYWQKSTVLTLYCACSSVVLEMISNYTNNSVSVEGLSADSFPVEMS